MCSRRCGSGFLSVFRCGGSATSCCLFSKRRPPRALIVSHALSKARAPSSLPIRSAFRRQPPALSKPNRDAPHFVGACRIHISNGSTPHLLPHPCQKRRRPAARSATWSRAPSASPWRRTAASGRWRPSPAPCTALSPPCLSRTWPGPRGTSEGTASSSCSTSPTGRAFR